MHVDVLKVPHHGSANNLDDDFFERITANHYVFSGDGEHGNPERESLEMLLARARRRRLRRPPHLSGRRDSTSSARRTGKRHASEEIARKAKNPNTKVREKWSAAKHSLGAFLKANPEFKDKIRIADDGDAHVVDLADPLGRAWPTLA